MASMTTNKMKVDGCTYTRTRKNIHTIQKMFLFFFVVVKERKKEKNFEIITVFLSFFYFMSKKKSCMFLEIKQA